jgi:hypothetical protein
MIDVGPLLAVNLDVDEELVHHRSDFGVFEALVRHDVAPMAGRIAHREQYGTVRPLRLGEGLRSPFPPIDRVRLMLQEIGRGRLGEPVHRVDLIAGGEPATFSGQQRGPRGVR